MVITVLGFQEHWLVGGATRIAASTEVWHFRYNITLFTSPHPDVYFATIINPHLNQIIIESWNCITYGMSPGKWSRVGKSPGVEVG